MGVTHWQCHTLHTSKYTNPGRKCGISVPSLCRNQCMVAVQGGSAGCQCRGERGEESLPLVIHDLTARYTIIQRYSCANTPMYFMRKLTRLRDIVLSRLKSKLRHCIVGMHQLGDLHMRGLNSKEERVDAFQGRHSCLHPGECLVVKLSVVA